MLSWLNFVVLSWINVIVLSWIHVVVLSWIIVVVLSWINVVVLSWNPSIPHNATLYTVMSYMRLWDNSRGPVPHWYCEPRKSATQIIKGEEDVGPLQHSDHYDQKRVCLQTYRSSQVSMTLHASCLRCHWHRMHMIFTFRSCSYIFFGMRCHLHQMHHACGVNDTACTVHEVSIIPHAF
jgi:hypothetical protein